MFKVKNMPELTDEVFGKTRAELLNAVLDKEL
jgi:hypothetical protein